MRFFFLALPLQHSVQQLLSAALKQLVTREHGIAVLQFAVSQTNCWLNAHCVPLFGRALHGAAHLDGGDTLKLSEYVSEERPSNCTDKKRTIIPEIGRGTPTFLFALRNGLRQTGVRFGFGDSLYECHFV